MRKKLLVTGGAGFIGGEFVRVALHRGYKVSVLDTLTYAADRARLKGVETKVDFHRANICDKKKVLEIVLRQKPDAIVHFAAESHVDRSILDSTIFIRTNIEGTQVLLDAARAGATPRFIHISTDEVYGDIEKGQFRESSPIQPSSPYAASKAAADLLVQSYIRTFDFPAVILRPSNNYGPWQYPEKFIPVVIYKALHDQKIPVYGKGINVREWLYVEDCAAGILLALEKAKAGEAYNLGSGIEMKNIDVVKKILDILGKPQGLISFVKDRAGHDIRYRLDSSKIKRTLGLKPGVDFETGIMRTIQWYRDNQSWLDKKVGFLEGYWKKVYR